MWWKSACQSSLKLKSICMDVVAPAEREDIIKMNVAVLNAGVTGP